MDDRNREATRTEVARWLAGRGVSSGDAVLLADTLCSEDLVEVRQEAVAPRPGTLGRMVGKWVIADSDLRVLECVLDAIGGGVVGGLTGDLVALTSAKVAGVLTLLRLVRACYRRGAALSPDEARVLRVLQIYVPSSENPGMSVAELAERLPGRKATDDEVAKILSRLARYPVREGFAVFACEHEGRWRPLA